MAYRSVSHEDNCTFEGRSGFQARAWIFVEPVQKSAACTFVVTTRREVGCRFPEALKFGAPTVTSVCRHLAVSGGTPTRVAALRGLFGSSWLSCELTAPAARPQKQTLERAERWCASVATTLDAHG